MSIPEVRDPRADVRLGAQGRLVVPASIRITLGFAPGDSLVACAENGRLVVEKVEAVEGWVRTRFAGLQGRSPADELIAERRAEARPDGRR